ncbi:hypothetical protein Cgig2_009479 [Carnegiea gigantea]|uniref:DUF4283 domain-containing protein n=1 Tax=Carnegiea gigantea TaxID=171969 RepID=A0A9Q1JJQ1_9CARY|nr:hypothetical protein Cgig2_009479 [Carnegiea gigantea]
MPAIATSEASPVSVINASVVEHPEITRASNTQVQTLSSYASVVDPEEGTDLKFIPTHLINGVRCAKLEKDDVAAEINYRQHAVLCSVLGANPLLELPDLDVKYWGAKSLSKTGSILGIPIKTYRYIKEKTMLRFARLLIDILLDSIFTDFIEFFNDNEVLIWQYVVYEWKPVKCAHCHMFGHEEQICKKKGGEKQE